MPQAHKTTRPPTGFPAAAIFDMDGVLVDSNPFHVRKWVELLKESGVAFDPEELPHRVLGHRNDTALRFYFGPHLRPEEAARLSEQLEEKFRAAFAPHARPLAGLETLLRECRRAGVPLAVASSAMRKNVEFVVEALGFGEVFRCLVSGDEVVRSKPEPEIYLLTAKKLGVRPEACVAFEDSPVGLQSARRAGMKCVGIASTFPQRELEPQADLVLRSLEEVDLERLRGLFRET